MSQWYRRWYSHETYLRIASAMGLSLCMCFNVLFVLNVVALLGFTTWLGAIRHASYAPMALLLALCIVNLAYAFGRPPGRPSTETGKLAFWYFSASFVSFILSLALLAILRPPPPGGWR